MQPAPGNQPAQGIQQAPQPAAHLAAQQVAAAEPSGDAILACAIQWLIKSGTNGGEILPDTLN